MNFGSVGHTIFFHHSSLLSISISSISQAISSVRHVSSLNRLTDGLGDLVVDIFTGDLGHNVAGLNLNWDCLDNGVSNSGSSNWGNMVSSISSEELSISISFGISLT